MRRRSKDVPNREIKYVHSTKGTCGRRYSDESETRREREGNGKR